MFTKNEEIAIIQGEEDLTFTETKPHYYGDVPVIEYIENEERQALFEPIESLINAYDKALSEKANDVDYSPMRISPSWVQNWTKRAS